MVLVAVSPVFYREADLDKINVSRYTTNAMGANLNFGYPIKETERLAFSLGLYQNQDRSGYWRSTRDYCQPRLYDVQTV